MAGLYGVNAGVVDGWLCAVRVVVSSGRRHCYRPDVRYRRLRDDGVRWVAEHPEEVSRRAYRQGEGVDARAHLARLPGVSSHHLSRCVWTGRTTDEGTDADLRGGVG